MNCQNPIQYFINYVDYYISQNPGSTISDVLDILNIFPNSANLCCPDNCSSYYMIIGEGNPNAENFSNFIGFDFDCCVNLHYIYTNYEQFLNNIQEINNGFNYPVCCNKNQFTNCVEELGEHLNSNIFNEWLYTIGTSRGIFEINTINGSSSFCDLVEILKTKSPSVALDYIMAILEKGLVISCTPQGVIMTNADLYALTFGSVPA